MFETYGLSAQDSGTGELRRVIRNRRDWLDFYDTRIANTVFCAMEDPPELDTRLTIDLLINKGPRLRLMGRVTWRREANAEEQRRAGVRIRVSNAQRKLLDRVDAWLRSGVRNRRRHRRVPVRLRATYSTKTLRRRVNVVRDLSHDGIFLAASQLMPLDSAIRLTVIPPGERSPQALTGRVARCVEEPAHRGMGIALDFEDARSRRHYTSLVDLLEHQYINGQLEQRNLA